MGVGACPPEHDVLDAITVDIASRRARSAQLIPRVGGLSRIDVAEVGRVQDGVEGSGVAKDDADPNAVVHPRDKIRETIAVDVSRRRQDPGMIDPEPICPVQIIQDDIRWPVRRTSEHDVASSDAGRAACHGQVGKTVAIHIACSPDQPGPSVWENDRQLVASRPVEAVKLNIGRELRHGSP